MARGSFWATGSIAGLLTSFAAHAEPVSRVAPLVSDDLEDYEAKGAEIGGFRLMPEFEYVIYGDDNVYASPVDSIPNGTQADAAIVIAAGLEAKRKLGNVDLTALAKTRIRRYDKLTTENSEAAEASLALGWQPRASQRLSLSTGWRRVVEERGDPESLQLTTTGPRLLNIFETQARFSHEGGVMLLSSDLAWRKYDFLGAANARRDFTSQFGSVTLGRSVGSRYYATATAYVTHRDFRLPITPLGGNQDQTTIGGRVGLATKDRGTIEGRASVGMFRLNPADPAQQSRTGLSADVSLTVRPQRRTAITLDVFSGDVATFRLGAVARSDTNVALGVQQEIRHNLHAALGLAFRRAEFIGTTDVEKSVLPSMQVEWQANKRLAISGFVNFNHRTSNIAAENFDRFRGGISLRLRL